MTTLPSFAAALLRAAVTPLLPLAVAWVHAQERRGADVGVPLNEDEQRDARALGVRCPERVRLVRCARVPLPTNALIRRAAARAGALSTEAAGLCLRYAIFVRATHWRDRLLVAHELAHTAQYERLGGVRPFLRRYLEECLTVGYDSAPLEWEAIESAARVVPQGNLEL